MPVGFAACASFSASQPAWARISASVAGPTFSGLAPSSSPGAKGGLVSTRMLAGLIPMMRHSRQNVAHVVAAPVEVVGAGRLALDLSKVL